VIEAMLGRSAAECGRQTYAWSRGKKSALANNYQHQNDVSVAGIALELNESYGNEGWWNTKLVEEAKPKMSVEDANKIIKFLSVSYGATTDPEAKAEFRRLANELRKASGQPVQ
jgi:hypothetical protein